MLHQGFSFSHQKSQTANRSCKRTGEKRLNKQRVEIDGNFKKHIAGYGFWNLFGIHVFRANVANDKTSKTMNVLEVTSNSSVPKTFLASLESDTRKIFKKMIMGRNIESSLTNKKQYNLVEVTNR